MATRRDRLAHRTNLCVEGLESRQLMAARPVSKPASYMFVDPYTSQPLSGAAAQVSVGKSATPHALSHESSHKPAHHSTVHKVVSSQNQANSKTSAHVAKPAIVAKPLIGPAYSGGMTPGLIRHAYNLDQVGYTGAGQVIAIVDAYDDPTIAQDLHTFNQKYGLPDSTFLKVVPTTGVPRYDAGWASEIALDVEWAHAVAPGATIMLVEAKSDSYTDLLSAVDFAVSKGAKEVSMSWGSTEARGVVNRYDSHFQAYGVSFFSASGDSGREVEHPSASSFVTSVGGTSLIVDNYGNRLSETAWSGSGGGISSYTPIPSYQKTALAGRYRGVPDVSFNADPNTGVYVIDTSSGGYLYVVGGTSAAAPAWAGIAAVVNQGRAAIGKPTIASRAGGTNAALYALGTGSARYSTSTYYHDVVAGSNGTAAHPGYDTVTGLGSPTFSTIAGLIAV